MPKEVQAVIDRSHASRADYTVSLTVETVREGVPGTEIDTEFQQGAMHRVEVPARRVLTNCETGEGSVYDVQGGRYLEDTRNVEAACGIDMNADRVVSARMLAPVIGPYGRADCIELTGKHFVRRYAVTPDGIIVGNDYIPRTPDVGFSLRTLNAVVRRGPQDPTMFTRESLTRGFAPDAGRRP